MVMYDGPPVNAQVSAPTQLCSTMENLIVSQNPTMAYPTMPYEVVTTLPMSAPAVVGPVPMVFAAAPETVMVFTGAPETGTAQQATMAPASRQTAARGSITDMLFEAVDVNHDGMISREEFRKALKSDVVRPAGATFDAS